MRGQLYRGSFAPGPYSNTGRVLVPAPMQNVPWVFLRAHAWPGRDRAQFERAAADYHVAALRARYFLPRETPTRATSAIGAVQAVSDASRRMAGFELAALGKLAGKIPLNAREARAALRTAMPPGVDFNAMKRQQAVYDYGVSYSARQIPFAPPPKAVFQALAAGRRAGAAYVDPRRRRAEILREHVMRETRGAR